MKRWLTLSLLTSVLLLGGCEETAEAPSVVDESDTEPTDDTADLDGEPLESIDDEGAPSGEPVESADEPVESEDTDDGTDLTYGLDHMDLPSADDLPLGEDYIELNNNVPTFTNDELEQVDPYVTFSDLDHLGRVGVADALLDEELMPPEQFERGGLGHVTPSGWNQNQRGDAASDIVPSGWLYNRSHLIGHQMAGEMTDVAENLMAGARHFNEVMIPFENVVANTVEQGIQVRYRVTPVFDGDNLLSHGVVMEGFSLDEDGDLGDTLTFNIFVPNEQDGITFDYTDGTWAVNGAEVSSTEPSDTPPSDNEPEDVPAAAGDSDSALQLINEGTAAALESVNGIGPAYAKRIIAYRDTHGAFKALEAIKNVDGIGDGVYNELRQNQSTTHHSNPDGF